MASARSNHRQSLVIHGALESASLLPWIARHAGRLGLVTSDLNAGPERISFVVEGQPELIDALEVGCLLGPIDVWVSSIDRGPETGVGESKATDA